MSKNRADELPGVEVAIHILEEARERAGGNIHGLGITHSLNLLKGKQAQLVKASDDGFPEHWNRYHNA